jgi:DNA-directed RNA polymerase subunit beta'
MTLFSPTEAHNQLRDRVASTIKSYFPVSGRNLELRANKVWVAEPEPGEAEDVEAQQNAKLRGQTWSDNVYAELELRDKATGKVIDRKAAVVGEVPKITRRYSYIVDGNEKQITNVLRLKPGVYSRIADDGTLKAQWNFAGKAFDLKFDPSSHKMLITPAGTTKNVPLYPILKAYGVDDDTLEKKWGKQILSVNKAQDSEKALKDFYMAFKGKAPPSNKDLKEGIRTFFDYVDLNPDSTKLTLGKPYTKVDGASLTDSATKLLSISRKTAEPDEREGLQFKEIVGIEDFVAESLNSFKSKKRIQGRLLNALRDKKTAKVSSLVSPNLFGRPINEVFTSSVAENATQTNPLMFISGHRQTTLVAPGYGGISKDQQISMADKSLHSSQIGFLDPLMTPESPRIGVNLQLATATRKEGKDLKTRVRDVKTGELKWIDAAEASASNVAFPDQYRSKGGKLVPASDSVKVVDGRGNIRSIAPKDVKYMYAHASGMFDVASNLIPFLQNNQGNRTMVASRQLGQAISLVEREEPLVQNYGPKVSIEKGVGGFAAARTGAGGTVEKVTPDAIIIRKENGEKAQVPLYNNFPLNEPTGHLSSNPLVKEGDKVKAGQVVSDTNFTKNGTLALGTNLKVAYTPFRGYNFEDGIVISETAAKKLTSDHLYRKGAVAGEGAILDKKRFLAHTAGNLTLDQAAKLGDDAIIKVGQVVRPGDVLIGLLKKETTRPEDQKIALLSKNMLNPVRAREVRWEQDIPGEVVRVHRLGDEVAVHVRALAPARIGDKIVGRHGNKGIISAVIPDQEMPSTKDGQPMEVLLNQSGVPSRINLGQVLETVASKIADKTGKPYVVNNFDPTVPDYARKVAAELEEHGLSDTEALFDPKTGKKMGDVLTGKQYILKLHHTADKGLIVRSRAGYSSDQIPQKGGPHGGQTMDAMGLYSLLAHGAKENIREFQALKGTRNDDFWHKLQAGDPIPPPDIPFAYKKLEGLLRGMGVDTVKTGNSLFLRPLTDKRTLEMSNGELTDAGRALKAKDAKPEKGGIFDPNATGTTSIERGLGDKWSHITLPARTLNPVFEKPAATLLGLTESQLENVLLGKEKIGDISGPRAVVDALRKVDASKREKELRDQLPTMRKTARNKAVKELKYLTALKEAGLTPKDAYTMKHLPVLPPTMRPATVLDNGSIQFDDVNRLYSYVGMMKSQLDTADASTPKDYLNDMESSMYDMVKGLSLQGYNSRGEYANTTQHRRSIAELVTGIRGRQQPKDGFFQNKVIGKRQDMSMRGTIVPEPSMSLDEVGIPRKAAEELYKPLVVRRMVQMGMTTLQAQDEIKRGSTLARSALETEVAERPILLKRDPVLHKYGVQAFRPKLVEGNIIKIHPLVTQGYSADFDGDKMSAFVPISDKAVAEAHKMLPSNNLFSPSTGLLMAKPQQEAIVGLYDLTKINPGKAQTFATAKEVVAAYSAGKLSVKDPIHLNSTDGAALDNVKLAAGTPTTLGRMLVYHALPEYARNQATLTDPNFRLTKGSVGDLLTQVAEKDKGSFGKVADRLKDLGNDQSTGMSIRLRDFFSDKESRDTEVAKAGKQEAKIRSSSMSVAEQNNAIVELYKKTADTVLAKAEKKIKASDNLMYDWVRSNARGNWNQFRQIAVAPFLVADSQNRPVPVPITKSYSEGLDIGSYWAAMHGARMGTIARVEGTAEPGVLSKRLMQATMNQVVTKNDCGTHNGVTLSVEDKDALNRFTARPIQLGARSGQDKGTIPAKSLVTPDLVNRLRNNKVMEVTVRSPLKCELSEGVCAICYGYNESGQLSDKGTNLGVIAAHSLGEPATQLAMKVFHEGGLVGSKATESTHMFERLQQLTSIPEKLPGVATLAHTEGPVEKVQRDAAGGWSVFIQGRRHYVPSSRDLLVSKGTIVKKGDPLSSGPKHPQEVLQLNGMPAVQQYLTDSLWDVYKNEGPVQRRNVETFVRAMTNTARVVDPGDHPVWMHNDTVPATAVAAYNKKLPASAKPVIDAPVLKGVEQLPKELQSDWLALLQTTKLRSTVVDAAAQGWKSVLHGTHPIPGMAYAKEFGEGTPEEPWLY